MGKIRLHFSCGIKVYIKRVFYREFPKVTQFILLLEMPNKEDDNLINTVIEKIEILFKLYSKSKRENIHLFIFS